MSNFYYGPQHHHSHSGMQSQHNHHGRTRRQTRASTNHHSNNNHQKQMKALRLQQKEAEETALLMERAFTYRRDFEAARDFEMEDDELFCPFNLMTEDDLQSMSSGSDRSSLSSGSPEHSPLQPQLQPAPTFLLPPQTFPSNFSSTTDILQPTARRVGGKAIPIVDPSTGTVASPPLSVSPGRHMPRGIPVLATTPVW